MLFIALPFVSLIIVIGVVRTFRSLRELRELRSRDVSQAISPGRRPSDDFHDLTWLPLCQALADAVAERLNRPLSAAERRTIWRTRTPLILNVVLKEIIAAPSAEEVAALLASLPPGSMDRPDPTGWCEKADA
jgi:hypothetical protein